MRAGFSLFAASWQWQPGHLHDPDPPFELEDKPFAGQRLVTTPGKVEPTYYRALTGNAATTAQGTLVPKILLGFDTFTDTNGTDIETHVANTGNTWTRSYWEALVPALPAIQSNRMKAADGDGISVHGMSGTTILNQYAEAIVRVDNVNTESPPGAMARDAIGVRLPMAGFPNQQDGYFFGLDQESGDGEWKLFFGGGVILATAAAAAQSVADTHTIRIEATGTTTVALRCYLDGTLVISYDDTVWGLSSAGLAGTWFNSGDAGAGGTHCLSIDYFECGTATVSGNNVLLGGAAATTAQGTITGVVNGGSFALTGYAATTGYGTLTPVVGFGAFPAGLAATATAGVMLPVVALGGAPGTPTPKLTATSYDDSVLTTWFPGYRLNTFLPVGGVLHGVGNDIDYTFTRWDRRLGLFKVSQTARDTIPWTATSVAYDTIDTDIGSALVASIPFPYEHSLPYYGYPLYTPIAPTYNTVVHAGGNISTDPDGHIISAHYAALLPNTAYNLSPYPESAYYPYTANNNGVEYYLAPQRGELASEMYVGTAQFAGYTYLGGNALLLGRYPATAPPRHTNALGIYAMRENEMLVFSPTIYDADITGVSVRLVGCRIAVTGTQKSVGVINSDPNKIVELVGRSATGRVGRMSVDGAVVVDLEGLPATTQFGYLVGNNPNLHVVPTVRRVKLAVNKNITYGTPPVSAVVGDAVPLTSFTGLSQLRALSGALCVTHSGYGDTIYATYVSVSATAVRGEEDKPSHIGLIVMDAATGTVTSHTLTAVVTPLVLNDVTALVAQAHQPYGPERSVAEVVKLSSGTSVTQFLMHGQIVHLSWTSGTATAPTLTLKTGPTVGSNTLIAGWESLEVRGDSVYHVLYRKDSNLKEDLTGVYVNDATGTSTTWTDTTTVYTGGYLGKLLNIYGGNSNNTYSGYGGGGPTWLYVTRVTTDAAPVVKDNHTIWVDFWDKQPAFFSVQAVGRVGRVTVNISYGIVDLTGLRANTAQGVLTPDLSISVALTGLRANTARGSITPTQQLTGLAATTAQGTLTPDLTVYGVLTGLVATTAQGSLQPPVSLALVGIRIYGYGGLLRPATGELVGLRATVIRGDVAPSGSSNAAQTGAAAVTAWGAATPNLAKAVVGYAATMGAGLLASTVGARLVGLPLLTATGVLTTATAVSVALTGRAATATGGTLAPQSALDTTLTGRSAVATAGTLIPLVTVTVTGARGTTSSGVLVPLLSPVVQGRQAVCAAGVLQVLTNIFLTGRQGTLVQGVLGHTHGCTLFPSGVWATGAVGVVSFKLPTDGSFLWVVQESDELAVQAEVQQEFVTISPN